MTARPENEHQSSGVSHFIKANWARIYFSTAILLIVLGYGMAAGIYHWFPYQPIANGMAAYKDWTVNAEQYARVKPSKHIRPARRDGDGVTIYDAEQAFTGTTLLSGMWGETLGMKLVSMEGELLHEWMVSFNEIWPQADHLERQPHDWDTNIHGLVAQPNGDIIFNFEHNGLVSINACGEVNWKIANHSHHVVHRAENGNLWVGDEQRIDGYDERFPLLIPPYREDFITELTPEGEIVRRISLLEVMESSGYSGLLVNPSVPDGPNTDTWRGTVRNTLEDVTHLNDIELLTPEMAAAFPQFAAGDIMLSLRNLDLVIVIDGETEEIKWAQTGPWLMQHDPDFLPDGRIMVFDNRARIRGQMGTRGSRIVVIDPVSRATTVAYQGNDEEIFFTAQMGKHQPLPNGNILIDEAQAGRAFEVTPKGEIVWEYINRWSDDEVAIISGAQRWSDDYFNIDSSCE